jgi:hypothetical protein
MFCIGGEVRQSLMADADGRMSDGWLRDLADVHQIFRTPNFPDFFQHLPITKFDQNHLPWKSSTI